MQQAGRGPVPRKIPPSHIWPRGPCPSRIPPSYSPELEGPKASPAGTYLGKAGGSCPAWPGGLALGLTRPARRGSGGGAATAKGVGHQRGGWGGLCAPTPPTSPLSPADGEPLGSHPWAFVRFPIPGVSFPPSVGLIPECQAVLGSGSEHSDCAENLSLSSSRLQQLCGAGTLLARRWGARTCVRGSRGQGRPAGLGRCS